MYGLYEKRETFNGYGPEYDYTLVCVDPDKDRLEAYASRYTKELQSLDVSKAEQQSEYTLFLKDNPSPNPPDPRGGNMTPGDYMVAVHKYWKDRDSWRAIVQQRFPLLHDERLVDVPEYVVKQVSTLDEVVNGLDSGKVNNAQ